MTETKPRHLERQPGVPTENIALYRLPQTPERLALLAASSLRLEGFEITAEQLLETCGQRRE
jgi:hypothetical protein